MRKQDHLLLPCRRVLYESSRLICLCGSHSECYELVILSGIRIGYVKQNAAKLSNFFEFSVNILDLRVSSTVLGAQPSAGLNPACGIAFIALA